jgi:hypothetical protein
MLSLCALQVWAVKTLMKLVNNDTKPEPVVRDLSNGVSGWQSQSGAGERLQAERWFSDYTAWVPGGLVLLDFFFGLHTLQLYNSMPQGYQRD